MKNKDLEACYFKEVKIREALLIENEKLKAEVKKLTDEIVRKNHTSNKDLNDSVRDNWSR